MTTAVRSGLLRVWESKGGWLRQGLAEQLFEKVARIPTEQSLIQYVGAPTAAIHVTTQMPRTGFTHGYP
jgi:hypothetical protein